jgi:tetratricopeptide (TPR) repeat protein
MMRKTVLSLLLLLAATFSEAQDNPTFESYLDFNLARLEGRSETAFELGKKILPDAGKLPEKSQISFYNSLAKLYEDKNEFDNAIPYYERVTEAVPDYYVAHRALGYIYLKPANDIGAKLNASKGNKAEYDKFAAAYRAAVNKALPHLEKAQACDPSPETLAIINSLYKNSGNEAGLATLKKRLALMAKSCQDILSD